VPIASAMAYVRGLLDGLPLPGGAPNLAAMIEPLDPDEETDVPTCYVWPLPGNEQRDPKNGGSMPRNSGPGTFSGTKTITHSIGVWVVWFAADPDPEDDDIPDADYLMPGFLDVIMQALRTAWPDPAIFTDPWTGEQTQMVDVGEQMKYELSPPHSTANQRYLRYDALITIPLTEAISA
jgi:hypothetical protein